MNALKHEGAAMCPRCGFVAGRAKDGCNQITCPKPCLQVFCIKCSRDWKLCRGLCKGGATQVLERAVEEKSPGTGTHSPDESGSQVSTAEEEEEEGDEEEKNISVKKKTKKRPPPGDPLFERFMKKAKTEVIEDEKDKNDPETRSDASDDEDKNAHDDEDDDYEFDIEDDEYKSDDGEDVENDELEEDVDD